MNKNYRLQEYTKDVEKALGLIDNTETVQDILDDDLVSLNMKIYKLVDEYLIRLEDINEKN